MFQPRRTWKRIRTSRESDSWGLTTLSFIIAHLLVACGDNTKAPDPPSQSLGETNRSPTASISPLHQALLERLQRRDSDYDGRTDVEEYREGGDPFDPASRRGALLARWRFDDPSLVGERGESPIRRVGAQAVAEPSGGRALRLDPEKQDAAVNYRVQELSGKPNINLREGTIRFRFRPDWSSGVGPGNIGVLLSVGVWNDETTYPFWGLIFNGSGDQIHFYSNGAGARDHMLEGNVHLNQGQWVTIHLAYSPTHCALWLDRQLVAERDLDEPPTILALDIANRDGFDLAANRYGGHPARGAIDDLELYNIPFTPEQAPQISDWGLYARFDPSSSSTRLETPLIPKLSYTIERTVVGPNGRSDFETVVTDFPGGVFTDDAVAPDGVRVYRASARTSDNPNVVAVRERTLDITSDPPTQRGTLALIVHELLIDPLQSSIDDYVYRAVADGWRVWTTHVNGAAATPADVIDAIRQSGALARPRNDSSTRPAPVAITLLGPLESLAARISEQAPRQAPWAISVIDFAAQSPLSEEYILQAKTYFDKLNRVSNGSLSLPNRILQEATLSSTPGPKGWLPQAHELAISLYGVDASRVDSGVRPPFTYMITTRRLSEIASASWALPSGSKTRPRIGLFLGDRFEIDRSDQVYTEMMRELARANSSVAAVSTVGGRLDFGLLAEGRSLAAARALSRRGATDSVGSEEHEAFNSPILGDATMRLFAKAAPENFSATLEENEARLSWEADALDILIERSDDGLSGAFVQLHSGPLESGIWSDPDGREDSIYRVRYRAANPHGPGPETILSHGALASPSWR